VPALYSLFYLFLGDGYLRRLLVQGAKSVIRHVRRRLLAGLPGRNPWVILTREEHYRQATMN
jgi:hypothetical protein